VVILVVVIVIVIVVVVVVVVVIPKVAAVMLAVFAMELTSAHILSMNPVMILPMSRYPYPQVAFVPIARAIGVIGLIAQIDFDPEPHGVWPHQQANEQESHCKNRKFRFHSCYNLFLRGVSVIALIAAKLR
jgi:hypothetical protein